MITVMTQAVLPSARAVRWRPLGVVATVALLVALVSAGTARPAGVLLAVIAAALASGAVAALHDPAEPLLTALPVSLAQRRVVRIALLAGPLLVVWWVVGLLTGSGAGSGFDPGPLVALTAVGVAVATWVRGPRAVLVGSCVPMVLVATHQLVVTGGAADALGWWQTEPWPVTAVAVVACVLGRRR